MSHTLDFKISYSYQSTKGGISIPVTLIVGNRTVDCFAKVDTGAEFCLFQRKFADDLELDLESGHLLKMDTLIGGLSAYGHTVTLITFDFAFETVIYFAIDYGLSRNLLGRNGWLQHLRLGLCDYDELLYLNVYDKS